MGEPLNDKVEARPSDQALVASDQAASRLAPSGFDPSRVERFNEGDPAFEEMLGRARVFIEGLCRWDGSAFSEQQWSEMTQQERLGLSRAMCAAIATEARRAETLGSVHEGAGPEDIAHG